LRKQIGGARGGKLPSLALDMQSGKSRSEVFWLNGAVADKGKATGVATPINQLYCDTLGDLLERPALQESWRGAHDRLAEAAQAVRTTR
jgi:2-dehydropantoate 2-reductase